MFSISDYDYNLPKELIAQYPLRWRDECRLLILDRENKRIEHLKFKDIIDFIKKDDLLVLNDTKVIPARIYGFSKETKGKVEVLLIKKINPSTYKVLLKPLRQLKLGKRFIFNEGNLEAEVIDTNNRLLRFNIDNLEKRLEEIGRIPLPPYIKRQSTPQDKEYYQTVYARNPGSIASPTAGLHFTKRLLERLISKGVKVSYITLDIGYPTFSPVKVSDIRNHKMSKEYFRIPSETHQLISETKSKGKRVFCVGTSVVRTLETKAEEIMNLKREFDIEGYTDLFIYPGFKFQITDSLITNFHLPHSTLLILTCAFANKELVMRAYRQAIVRGYRFYSYGDCMLIL